METEGDINVLLETIACRHLDNPTAVKDALLTLASMCTTSNGENNFLMILSNLLRKTCGLHFFGALI